MYSSIGNPSHRCNNQYGFSLYEMLITLAIASTLAIGSISLYSIVKENNVITATNLLVAHLNFARSEAVKRRVEIVVCPSHDARRCDDASAAFTSWSSGYLVYVNEKDNNKLDLDEPILKVESGKTKDLTIKTSRHRTKVTYQPTGMTGGSALTFAFCDSRGPRHARYVTVHNAGRARVSRTTESDMRC